MEIYEKKIPILVGNEESFEKVCNNLLKKSKKLGLHFRYSININEIYTDGNGKQWVPTRIVYELPSMGDYRLIATLEIYDNKNLIEVVDSRYKDLISENVREVTPYCHHCKQNRQRRYLYLIYDKKKKRVLQLGKSCSKSFIGGGNIERLYKYAEELGQVEKSLRRKPKYRRVYYPTEEYTRLVISKFVDNYRNKTYATVESLNDEFVNEQIKSYMRNNLGENTVNLMNSNEVSQIYQEVKNAIDSKQNEVDSPEYNAKTVISKRYVRDDKKWKINSYIADFIDNNARGYDLNDTYHVFDVVNTAIDYLTQPNVEFHYQGEESSYINVIKNIRGGISENNEELRTEWVDYIVRKQENNFEGIIIKMLKDPQREITSKEVKIVVNNIGFFLKNYDQAEGEYHGKIGERLNLTVKKLGTTSFEREAYMGGVETVYVYKLCLTDNEDVEFVWYTPKTPEELGINDKETINISAKIKDHKTYKGKKQTIINYTKVVG